MTVIFKQTKKPSQRISLSNTLFPKMLKKILYYINTIYLCVQKLNVVKTFFCLKIWPTLYSITELT